MRNSARPFDYQVVNVDMSIHSKMARRQKRVTEKVTRFFDHYCDKPSVTLSMFHFTIVMYVSPSSPFLARESVNILE